MSPRFDWAFQVRTTLSRSWLRDPRREKPEASSRFLPTPPGTLSSRIIGPESYAREHDALKNRSTIAHAAPWLATISIAIAVSATPSWAEESRSGEWLLHRVALRPSMSADYTATLGARLESASRPEITVLVMLSQSRRLTFLMAADDRTTAPWSALGTLDLPTPSTVDPDRERVWLVDGTVSSLDAGSMVHLGVWVAEAGSEALVRRSATEWAAATARRAVLEVLDTRSAPVEGTTFVTLATGASAAADGGVLANELAPHLERAEVEVGTIVHAIHGQATRDQATRDQTTRGQATRDPATTAGVEPLRPLPDPSAETSRSSATAPSPPVPPMPLSDGSDAPLGDRIASAARESVNRAPRYDTGYHELPYPGGDPGWDIGSGVDVVIRALRAHGIDLQTLVHEDIERAPAAYGYEGREIDASIAHRRLRNLVTFFERWAIEVDDDRDLRVGDIVVWDVLGNDRPGHLGIVTRHGGDTTWLIHHYRDEPPFTGIPSEDAVLEYWPRWSRFRIDPAKLPAASAR